jgi:hypothetical protein
MSKREQLTYGNVMIVLLFCLSILLRKIQKILIDTLKGGINMGDKIQIESYSCCQWYDMPPVFKRCPYLVDNNYCSLYNTSLKNGKATDSWTGRDSPYVERCDGCKKN